MSQLTLEIKQLIIDARSGRPRPGRHRCRPALVRRRSWPRLGGRHGTRPGDSEALRYQDRRRRQGHPQAFRQRRQPGSFRQRQPRHRLRSICREQPQRDFPDPARRLVELFELEAERITLEANLYQDTEIDSIDAVDLIDHIKRQTGKKIAAENSRPCAPSVTWWRRSIV